MTVRITWVRINLIVAVVAFSVMLLARLAGGASTLETLEGQFAQAGTPFVCVEWAYVIDLTPERPIYYWYSRPELSIAMARAEARVAAGADFRDLVAFRPRDPLIFVVDSACENTPKSWFGDFVAAKTHYEGMLIENYQFWPSDVPPLPTPTVTPAPTPTPGSIWWRPWPWRR